MVTRALRSFGYRVTALDVEYWREYQRSRLCKKKRLPGSNFFNLLTPSGFLAAALAILSCRPNRFLAVCAAVCSSWVSISRASCGRSFLSPMGFPWVPSVRVGNMLTSRPGLLF